MTQAIHEPVYIIGAGAAGGSLAAALVQKGVPVVGICDTDSERAMQAASPLGIPATSHLTDAVKAAEVVLVAVPDGAIKSVAKKALQRNAFTASQVWLHLSGARPASDLDPLRKNVRAIGACHPAHVFAPNRVTLLTPGLTFAVDGNRIAQETAQRLAAALGGYTVTITSKLRPAYHATTVMASNCIVALIAEARDLLAAQGVPAKEAERLLVTLAISATAQAEKRGLSESLSGPIRRGDADTVSGHLTALAEAPDSATLYRLLGRATLRLALEIEDTDEAALKAIARLLGE